MFGGLTYLVEEWLRDLLQSDSGDVLSSLPGTACLFLIRLFQDHWLYTTDVQRT